MDSRISGFYSLSLHERREAISKALSTDMSDLHAWSDAESLDESTADRMIENVVGRLSLPVGIAMNFLIDGESTFIPFCVEESSIVAAATLRNFFHAADWFFEQYILRSTTYKR